MSEEHYAALLNAYFFNEGGGYTVWIYENTANTRYSDIDHFSVLIVHIIEQNKAILECISALQKVFAWLDGAV